MCERYISARSSDMKAYMRHTNASTLTAAGPMLSWSGQWDGIDSVELAPRHVAIYTVQTLPTATLSLR
jgi:hypothetical protein